MHINEQIDKVFGNINHNNKRKYHEPEKISKLNKNNNILRENKKIIKKHSNKSFHSNSNISIYSKDNNKEKKNLYLKNNEDSSFYVEFMKKIKEDIKEVEKEENGSKIINRKSKNFQMKSGLLKQENTHSKHFLEGKKELAILKNNHSLINEDKNNESMIQFQKINQKSNFDESNNTHLYINNTKNSKIILNNMNNNQSQNILNLNNETINQNTINSRRCFNLKEEKVQNSIQLEIINNFKKFNLLKVQKIISFGQLNKDVNCSDVNKLNVNNHENNNNNRSIDNVNQNEIIYPSSNNLLKTKKNPIFCCF